MRINHNIAALNTYRQLTTNNVNAGKSLEKLSSGSRINRAGDDAAGLAISEKMRSQIRGLEQASRNSQDGISLIQTAEGALGETHAMLQRMRELVTQANNGTNKLEDRQKIQTEIGELQTEITNIADKTQFNKQNLLDGTLGATTATVGALLTDGTGKLKIADVTGAAIGNTYKVDTSVATKITVTNAAGDVSQTLTVGALNGQTVGTKYNFDKIGIVLEAQNTDITTLAAGNVNSQFDVTASGVKLQTGANAGDQMAISIGAMDATTLGIDSTAIDVGQAAWDSSAFDLDIAAIDSAITTVSNERSKMGAWQNRLEHTINNLNTSAENLTAAESRIRDVDMAKEMMEFTKSNIITQAAQSMLAQANQQPQGVLQLLR